MNAYFGLMDFSKYLNINCNNSNIKISHELLLKYLSVDNYYNFTNTKKFGYPNSNIFPTNKVRNSYHLNKNILSNIIDMDEKNEIAKNLNEDIKPEIILEFFNNYTEANISINVTYKKSLADKRRLKENKLSIYDNILFIFFDILSRVHFQRSMPKTSKFIEKFMKYNEEYSAYQFNKYHSIGGNTHPN